MPNWRTVGSNQKVAVKAAATLVNGTIVFTIAGGPIRIEELLSECITTNDATASTLQWQSAPTVGSAQTISAATTTLASIAAGATVRHSKATISTAPAISLAAAGGVQVGPASLDGITVQPGTIKTVIGVGSTTGTWKHYLLYTPLAPGVTVS